MTPAHATPTATLFAPAPAATAPRVLLVNLNKYTQPYPVYPLGLSYINGALRAAGCKTLLWDNHVDRGEITECAKKFRPDFIGLSLRNIDNAQSHNPLSFVGELADCCADLRAVTNAPVIVGGSGFSIFPKELLELTGADYGIQGEGEAPFVALLAALRANDTAAAQRIPGAVWREPPAAEIPNPEIPNPKKIPNPNIQIPKNTMARQRPIENRVPSEARSLTSKIENPPIHCNPRLHAHPRPPNSPAPPASP